MDLIKRPINSFNSNSFVQNGKIHIKKGSRLKKEKKKENHEFCIKQIKSVALIPFLSEVMC